eukprot:TRINITY_DN3147_c5_g1_i1.p1 TRINITY_DN3147_c5_g1~~TRINITY_DN3147_c5_g1_i1.p1  ORF type:complete len:115 (+),score=19.24 TRINITY_DN3147_c5_g1_i1:64-408(+)
MPAMAATETATLTLVVPIITRDFEPHGWSTVIDRHWMWFVLALALCVICILIGMWNKIKERFIKEKPGALSFREYGMRLQKLEEEYELQQAQVKQSQIDMLVDCRTAYEPLPEL